jgi:predicted RNase H-like HicB family nuclease
VDVTDNHGCTSSDSVEVTIHEPPVADLGEDAFFCQGAVAVLDAGYFAIYAWSVPDSVSRTLHITEEGEYWVQVTDIYGCSDYDTIIMQHYPAPVVSLGNDTMICPGSSVILDAGSGFISYSWSVPDSTGRTVTVSDAGIYSVVVTDNNGCAASDTIIISHHLMTIPSLGFDRDACEGFPVTLDAGAGFTSYQWSVPDSAGRTHTVYSTGEYSVTATDAAGCVTGDTVFVTFHTLPVANLGNDITGCEGQAIVLDAVVNASGYEWSVPDSVNRTITVSASGSYWVKITDGYGCQDADTLSVIFQPLPVPALGLDTAICPGGTITLDAGTGYTGYEWSVADSTGRTLTVTAAGTYTVTVTDASGCSGSDAIEIGYFHVPDVQITGKTDICTGETTLLDAGIVYSGYLWSTDPPSTEQSITTGTAGIYRVDVTNSYGCAGWDTIEVKVHELPVPELAEEVSFCQGKSTVLDAGSFAGYEWSVQDSVSRTLQVTEEGDYWVKVTDVYGCSGYDTITASFLPDPVVDLGKDTSVCGSAGITLDAGSGFTGYQWSPSGNTRTLYVTSEGNYSVTVTDVNGCTGSDAITVTRRTGPAVDLGEDMSFCQGTVSTLDAGTAGTSWLWSTGETTRSIQVSETDTYWVRVSGGTDCISYDTVDVQVLSAPVVDVIAAKNPINSKDSTLLTATGASDYAWSPAEWLSSGTGSPVYAKPLANTTFYLTGTDSDGCQGSDSIRINVFCPTEGRNTVIDDLFGTIDFTCANRVYRNNDTSTWLLLPKAASLVYIDFNHGTFDIHPGDTVRVFEGHDNTGKLLARYNNNRKPSSRLVANYEMYIEFITNASGTGEGFKAYFWTDLAGGANDVPVPGELKIYPNPFSESTIIEFPNPDFASYRLIIMDVSGKIHLMTGEITGSRYELQRDNLENGFYIIELVGPQVFRGRILIE